MQKDRFYFIVVIFLSSIFYVSANDVQDNENKMAFKGYSGGMMLHAGYAQSGLFSLYEDDEAEYDLRFCVERDNENYFIKYDRKENPEIKETEISFHRI